VDSTEELLFVIGNLKAENEKLKGQVRKAENLCCNWQCHCEAVDQQCMKCQLDMIFNG